ncbi:helix-turn-helix transcriptional regulator [Inquilinus limosus]|uniref:AraC family transcriptional regulator n=1 Tax=Inquilinus limosus TaxID=171674 RepID=A0A211Z2F2_9PROT|nr:AraC family transcriptional regulator [Inquilinus limosus]OWJ59420.1 AraC family transcriptional regulator [Inquilinus limosus]
MSTALRIAHGSFGRVALLDMDRPLVRHAHPHCHVLLKVEGADTRFMVGDVIVPLTDRTAVLVNGWEPHAYVHDPDRPRTLILALYVEPHWLDTFRTGWAASGTPGFFGRPCGETSPRIRTLAHDLAVDMVSRPEARESHERLLSDLMIAVIERFADWQAAPSSVRALASRPHIDWRIRRAIGAMRDGIGEEGASVSSLADTAGLSRAHFFRLFGASVNVSPRVYFNVMRLESAVAAIVDDDANLTEISQRLGFSAPPHFTRFFRDHAGVAPSEFRSVARLAS